MTGFILNGLSESLLSSRLFRIKAWVLQVPFLSMIFLYLFFDYSNLNHSKVFYLFLYYSNFSVSLCRFVAFVQFAIYQPLMSVFLVFESVIVSLSISYLVLFTQLSACIIFACIFLSKKRYRLVPFSLGPFSHMAHFSPCAGKTPHSTAHLHMPAHIRSIHIIYACIIGAFARVHTYLLQNYYIFLNYANLLQKKASQ